MKKLFVLLALVFAFNSLKAQTIDTTFKGGITVCKIFPVLAQWNDKDSSKYLGVSVIADNLKSSATLYWQLIAGDSTVKAVTAQGNFVMQGADYQSWCNTTNPENPAALTVGCQEWPFYLVGKAYNLVFVPGPTNNGKPNKN